MFWYAYYMIKDKCQAKDPSTCHYHGTELRMKAAAAAGDLDTYFKERTAFEALTPETEKPAEEGSEEFFEFKLFNPFTIYRNKKLEANSFSAEEFEDIQTNVSGKEYNVLEALNLKPNDKVALSKVTADAGIWLHRKVYKQENGKWVYVGYGTYHEHNVADATTKYALNGNLTKALRVTVLAFAAHNQVVSRYRV